MNEMFYDLVSLDEEKNLSWRGFAREVPLFALPALLDKKILLLEGVREGLWRGYIRERGDEEGELSCRRRIG
jgi:hypothetical protein